MTGADPEPDRLLCLADGPLGRMMSGIERALREAETLLAREPDPTRRDAMSGLVRDLEVRAAPISADFARACLDLLDPVRPEEGSNPTRPPLPSDESGRARLGLRLAAALFRVDPRVHGARAALHELRATLLEQGRAGTGP